MPLIRQPVSLLPESLEFLDPGIDPSGMVMPLVTRTPQLLERLATRGLGRIDVGLVRELAKTKPGSPEARTIIDLMALTRGGGEPAVESFKALTGDIPLSPEGIASIPSKVMNVLRGARERYLGKALERLRGGQMGQYPLLHTDTVDHVRRIINDALEGSYGSTARSAARGLPVTGAGNIFSMSPVEAYQSGVVENMRSLLTAISRHSARDPHSNVNDVLAINRVLADWWHRST